MSKSLQDQLLGAGLVDKKKAKSIAKSVRKEAKQKKRGEVDQTKQQALLQAQQDKKRRDKQLNEQIKAEQAKKAIQAQIAQLIERHRIRDRRGDLEYNFKDGKTIKKMFLKKLLHDQLCSGVLSVVKSGESYDLVPRVVAHKIREREASQVLVDNYGIGEQKPDENDPYADYVIPDDLMW